MLPGQQAVATSSTSSNRQHMLASSRPQATTAGAIHTVADRASAHQLGPHKREEPPSHAAGLYAPGTRLVLQHCAICLQSMAGLPGLLHGLKHLTHLSLHFSTVLDVNGLNSLSSLAALPDLQHLSLGALLDGQGQGLRQLEAPDLLPKLSKLTYLEVSKRLVLSVPSMQQLSCLSDLQTLILHFRGNSEVSTAALGALFHCPRLQRMDLSHPGVPIDLSTAPFLQQQPSALLQFKLAHGALDMHALGRATQLQHLELNHVQLLPAGAATALLSLLPALQQLQHLRLGFLQCQWPPISAQYSAITASSRLMHLELSGCLLPAGVWQHVFPAGRTLLHLSSVLLGHVGVRTTTASQPALAAGDVAQLARCCPGLQELQLWRQLQPHADLEGLQQLPELTRLWLADVGPGVISHLATLKGLRDVYVLLQVM